MKRALVVSVLFVLVCAVAAQAAFTVGANAPLATSRPGAVVVDGKAYLVGGEYSGKALSNQIHIYDFAAATWSTSTATMPVGLSNICVATDREKIFVVGGYNGGPVNTLYIYDIAGDSWSSGATLTSARNGVGCAVHDGYLYAFGGTPDGSNGLTDTLIYDIDGDSWSSGTAMPAGM